MGRRRLTRPTALGIAFVDLPMIGALRDVKRSVELERADGERSVGP